MIALNWFQLIFISYAVTGIFAMVPAISLLTEYRNYCSLWVKLASSLHLAAVVVGVSLFVNLLVSLT